jgi:K+-transporting ATPase KdpF subunit
MADLWFVLVLLAFFGLCVGFVRACDVIIGPDEASDLRENIAGLVIAVLLALYLFAALIFPERF